MTEFIGQSGDHVLFSDSEKKNAVIVDSTVSLVVTSGEFSTLHDAEAWGDGEYSDTDATLASTVLASLEVPEPETTGRLYTIPRGVQVNARNALTAAAEETASARYVGSLLASGGQVSFNELTNIAAFFAKTEDQDSTIWRLYGGAPAKKWATSIIDREAVTAAASAAPADLARILEENPDAGPEFITRIHTETGVMDRLYRIDIDKRVYVWDASEWNDLGQTEWNIWDYDFALDGKTSDFHHKHILIDPESALAAAALQAEGAATFTVDDIAPVEAALAVAAIDSEDWDFVDTAMVAAGALNDGIYSDDERSENASKQIRDARGQFARTGTHVKINNDPTYTGTISSVDQATGNVVVALDAGGEATVPANTTEEVEAAAMPAPGVPLEAPKVDFSGILAEERKNRDRKVAELKTVLPLLDRKALEKIIENFAAWVKKKREEAKVEAKDDPIIVDAGKRQTAVSTRNTGGFDHPLLRNYAKPSATPVTAAAYEQGTDLTPATSDVDPVYMAIVSPDDPRAVFKLISLVPANDKSNQPMVYSREEGEWKRDEPMLSDLRSATPPPVVALNEDTLDDVLAQVDDAQGVGPESEAAVDATPVAVPTEPDAGSITASAEITKDSLALMVLWGPNPSTMSQAAIIAAGGLDRNRGGADKLRRYWLHGAGAAKIRWGTPGDWTRCVRNLSKHLGPRAKGYCALRHKEATGQWTGDKKHRQKFALNTPVTVESTELIQTTEAISDLAWTAAKAAALMERTSLTASAGLDAAKKYKVYSDDQQGLVAAAAVVPQLTDGGAFFIPLVIPEVMESGDGRKVDKYALDMRNLPLPLMWQIKTGEGHDGAVVVGKIERMGRTPLGIGAAYGHFDTGVYGREAERMVRAGYLRHVSADMDKFEAEQEEASEKDGKFAKNKLAIRKARVMGATIVAKPAFQECIIEMAPDRVLTTEDIVLPDGIISEEVDPMEAVALVAAGYIADAIPVVPPRAWFENPNLKRPTPLTVDDNGHVFGHVAAFNTPHMNAALNGVNPPHNYSGYAYFNKGVIRTDDGSDVTVGQLTLVGGHADLNFNASQAARHYDDTASAFADVHAGEDEYGIWVAGALRPGVTAAQVRQIRASTPSGDWRPIRGKLELIAVCQVNVPGFPIARAMVASGHTMALTAAGASELARLRPDPILDLARRVQELEKAGDNELTARVTSVMSRVTPHIERRNAELAARAEAATARMESFGFVSKKSREQATEKGEALPDGSYPIRNEADLKNAIKAYGRAKESERSKVRKHIMKRARALGKADLIPAEWKNAASASITASLESMRARVAEARGVEVVLQPGEQVVPLVADAKADMEKLTEGEKAKLVEELKAAGKTVPEALLPKAQRAESAEKQDQPAKYKPGYQPRDYNGQFKQVLARLKTNLGVGGNQGVVDDIEAVDAKIRTGDYVESVRAGLDLRSRLDRIDAGALNGESIGNVREASRDLGKAIANMPLPFDNQAEKLRYTDIPPALRDLMDDLVKKVIEKIGTEDGNKATAKMRAFKAGSDMFSQSEISREMSRFLRLLT